MRSSPTCGYQHHRQLGIIPAHAGLTSIFSSARALHRDHPRAYGAHKGESLCTHWNRGSSPRMRGSRIWLVGRLCGRWIIPAHAGLTVILSHSFIPLRDHPRACGAHHTIFNLCFNDMGSSPRMRGSRPSALSAASPCGIIPAHAGLTLEEALDLAALRDHPRACGAHAQMIIQLTIAEGSSPRMRGSLEHIEYGIPYQGIIPAHAGLTMKSTWSRKKRRDHPRACGAHIRSSCTSVNQTGSSPRMRGSQEGPVRAQQVHGIIPAHAGLTCSVCEIALMPKDHPRACGAHITPLSRSGIATGSSPRMRGSLSSSIFRYPIVGIIPAHAGLTRSYGRILQERWDHPRACGAHTCS